LHGPGFHKLLTALLAVLVVLNMSQAVVICVGADGHVAVETAGHDHCSHDARAYDSSVPVPAGGDPSHAGGASCEPCTDIPICAGAVEDSFKSSHVSVNACMPASCNILSASAIETAAGAIDFDQLLSLPTFFLPLRTVVLQL
jgi:hypothetical protein